MTTKEDLWWDSEDPIAKSNLLSSNLSLLYMLPIIYCSTHLEYFDANNMITCVIIAHGTEKD
jgi:hypothetical protein